MKTLLAQQFYYLLLKRGKMILRTWEYKSEQFGFLEQLSKWNFGALFYETWSVFLVSLESD